MSSSEAPVVVVGGGAAGLMAAIFAARGGARVVLLERTSDGGRKILISGGGRCNVLPSVADPSRFVTDSSQNTLRKILLSWPLPEQRAFFESDLGIPLALEPETGKLFPVSNRARDVRDGLVEAARNAGVECRFGRAVADIRRGDDGRWIVETAEGEDFAAAAVIIATGGLSVPKTGSDGTGLRLARAVGHTIHPTYPALTPLTTDPPVHAELAGVSLAVRLTAPAKRPFSTRGGFLFTHRGYSGPSVLDVSHLAVRSRIDGRERQRILVQWTDQDSGEWDRLLREGGGTVTSVVRRHLPARLADALIRESRVAPDQAISTLRRDDRLRLVAHLTSYELPWTGDEGYRKAEVTGGGVALGEVDPRTLESRRAEGLFLCGEVLDAFGPIGGHNFLWSWATGRAAGQGAARRVTRAAE